MNSGIWLALSAVFIAAVAQVFLKKQAMKTAKNFIMKFLNFNVIFGYSLMLISTVLNVLALRTLDLGILPAIEATSYIWVLLFSAMFIKEKPTKNKLLGLLVIIGGIVIYLL